MMKSTELEKNKKNISPSTEYQSMNDLNFIIKSSSFNEHYTPSSNSRTTTNFANLARGVNRQENLRNTIKMMNNRFNQLARWDNPNHDRYSVELEIISVDIDMNESGKTFPSIEMLKTNILDHKSNKCIEGIVGNNFSSYVRDYDFSILLSEHQNKNHQSIPPNFGELHGNIFKCFTNSNTYIKHFLKPPVICLSVSSNKTYYRTGNHHPILGFEYESHKPSLTEFYFKKMGLKVRYFIPADSVAPLAFYFTGDLLMDYTNLELISTISVMETFQKIYRPEIYNANSVAGLQYKPTLQSQDYSLTKISYDREERTQLGIEQGKFAEKHFIKPYQDFLQDWSSNFSI